MKENFRGDIFDEPTTFTCALFIGWSKSKQHKVTLYRFQMHITALPSPTLFSSI
jgi:hypothetical protein